MTAPDLTGMATADLAKEIARREAMGTAWTDSARPLREALHAKARKVYEDEDSGVTWTLRDLGKVILPLSTEAPQISDIAALLKWCKERHPEHVETVEQVSSAFQSFLLKTCEITAEGVVIDPETAEVVPGMSVREGGKPKSLSITIDREPKALLAHWATGEVGRQLVAEYGEVPDAA
jgi:hypothetical protein